MNAKQRAIEIYNLHLALASADGRNFRKTVMDQLMAETGCSLAAAATHYNNAKKQAIPIEGLGRAAAPKGIRRPGSKAKPGVDLQPDNECFAVVEVLSDGIVGRTQTFLRQGDASEKFDEKVSFRPEINWVMLQGLGPLSGDKFKLDDGEKIIKENRVKEIA